jgi:hypothetical protein
VGRDVARASSHARGACPVCRDRGFPGALGWRRPCGSPHRARSSVIAAYERRIANLEREKLVIIEKLQANAFPKRGSAEQFELAFRFLENPQELWASERLDDKRLVLKLTFADRLAYCRNGGFRTPQTTLPFKALGAVGGGKCKMAGLTGEFLNAVARELAEWNDLLS